MMNIHVTTDNLHTVSTVRKLKFVFTFLSCSGDRKKQSRSRTNHYTEPSGCQQHTFQKL